MVKYSCEHCDKEFSSKSSYDRHKKRKIPCTENNDKLNREKEITQLKKKKKTIKLKVVSMFAGCGGLDYAFHKSKKFKVIYANDIDKDSCDTYKNYYKLTPKCKDIKKVKSIPDCDVLTGGFPCQGFSIANTYRQVGDTRNELYKELVRLLKLSMPKYFIFENVKGILSLGGYDSKEDKKNSRGKIFKMIVNELEECDYTVHTKLFKMKWYNVPQNRERVIFIGIRNDINDNIEFEWPEEKQKITKTLKDAIGDLSIEYDEESQHIGTKHKVKLTGYMGNRKLDWDSISPTITGRGGGTGGPVINVHPSEKRRMTVREYARIQTFPDDFKFSGSVSSMYRQIGNAVPPKFSYVLARLITALNDQLSNDQS
jgi:DNA (cytosine-5)-methyltransferase 1